MTLLASLRYLEDNDKHIPEEEPVFGCEVETKYMSNDVRAFLKKRVSEYLAKRKEYQPP